MDDSNQSKKLKIMTRDNKMFEVDVRIKNFVKIFLEILEDYDIDEVINLENIDSSSFDKIINFCKQLQFKPFMIDIKCKSNKQLISQLNSNAKCYYDSMKFDEIQELINISDYLGVGCLLFLCNLKLGELFSKKENLSGLLMLNPEDLDISIERENELREKYLKYDLNETIDESLLNEYLIQNE